jgi:hypothetical protein
MYTDHILVKREATSQTEAHPVIDFLSQYSLSKINSLSNNESRFVDKEVLFLSRKKYKGRPSKVNSVADKDLMSFNDKNNYLQIIFDEGLDLVLSSISKFQISCKSPIWRRKGLESQIHDTSVAFDFLRIQENYKLPSKNSKILFQNNLFLRKNVLFSITSKDDLRLIEDLCLQFKCKSSIEWPKDKYRVVLLYYQRKLIDTPILTETTSIDFMNFLVFTSKIKTNLFVVLAFGISVLSRFLPSIFSELILHYCAHCLAALRSSSFEYSDFDDLIRIEVMPQNELMITVPVYTKNLGECISLFLKYFDSQLEGFSKIISKDNPEIIFDTPVFQEFLDSLHFNEFLVQTAKLFQINS